MEHLSEKPFFLTDEDILWVADTFADMGDDEKLARLVYAAGGAFPLSDVACVDALQVRDAQNKGLAAYVLWEAQDMGLRECIAAGVMAVKLGPDASLAGRADNRVAVLREGPGFNGLVIGEGFGGEGTACAVAAGVDMVFSGGNPSLVLCSLKDGLRRGIITYERLREAVMRILAAEAALGLHK